MKLANFKVNGSEEIHFGLVVKDHAVPFSVLERLKGSGYPELADMRSYLSNLPESEYLAGLLQGYAVRYLDTLGDYERFHVSGVRFVPPVNPPALIDFGLSPRHLKNSAMTLLKHEYGKLSQRIIGPFVKRRLDRMSRSLVLPYYKCNHNEIIGDMDVVGWPSFTSYLDIEPELGIVVGTGKQQIAGYLIFNDMSARDVQMPEMMGTGPARSKDFSNSKGVGPYLVTPDEVTRPLSLGVKVKIGDRYSWSGSTAEYTRSPGEVVSYIRTVFTPLPGTIIGMGTIPDCTGIDHDLWLHPGDLIEITFDRLGTLRQVIPLEIGRLEHTRWKARGELETYYRQTV